MYVIVTNHVKLAQGKFTVRQGKHRETQGIQKRNLSRYPDMGEIPTPTESSADQAVLPCRQQPAIR